MESFRILKEFAWFEWFEWFDPSPIEPFNPGAERAQVQAGDPARGEVARGRGGPVAEPAADPRLRERLCFF